MPKIIDHVRRKEAILHTAFSLFARNGYQNTSLSHLAEACGISRPTLYLYFRDKEEIFNFAVKYFTDAMFAEYRALYSRGGSYLGRIEKICGDVVRKCWKNRDFITSLGDFLFQMRYEGRDFADAIKRRTVKFDHLLRKMFKEGIESGEIRPLPVEITVTHLFDLIQSFLFKLAVLINADPDETIRVFGAYLQGLKTE